MGSEQKSRKRRSPLSHSDKEDVKENSKKDRKREEKERRRRKDQDNERRKRGKSHDHADEKSREKHKHSSKLSDIGFKKLSDDDYFSKNNEFSTWLKDEKGIYFSELSSEAARDLFSSFIKAWNRRKLQHRYYDGIASAPRSSHNWNIKNEK